MNHQTKIEVIRRLVIKGKIFEAEIACEELGISKKVIYKFQVTRRGK